MLLHESKFLFIIIFILIAAISVFLTSLSSRILIRKKTSPKARIVVSFLLFLLLSEVFLRIIDIPDSNRKNYIRAGWKTKTNYMHINQLGYRGQLIEYSDSTIVVVLIGDSTVEVRSSPFELLPEQLLEEKLRYYNPNYKVFTLGTYGYGTDQQYLALEEYYKKYRADHVVLWQSIQNDIWNNVFPTGSLPRDGELKPTYWLNENGKLDGPNFYPGEIISYLGKIEKVKIKLVLLLFRIIYNQNYHPEVGMDGAWEKNLPESYQPFRECNKEGGTDWDPKHNYSVPNFFSENLSNEKSNFAIGLVPKSKRLGYGLELTNQLLRRIDSLSTENNSIFSIFYAMKPEQRKSIGAQQEICQRIDTNYYIFSDSELIRRQRELNSEFRSFEIPIISDIHNTNDSETNKKIMGSLADNIVQIQN